MIPGRPLVPGSGSVIGKTWYGGNRLRVLTRQAAWNLLKTHPMFQLQGPQTLSSLEALWFFSVGEGKMKSQQNSYIILYPIYLESLCRPMEAEIHFSLHFSCIFRICMMHRDMDLGSEQQNSGHRLIGQMFCCLIEKVDELIPKFQQQEGATTREDGKSRRVFSF